MNINSKRIALVYFCISAVWIFTSDMLFESVLSDYTSRQKYVFNILKGIGFVSVTTILLYKLITKYYNTLKRSEEEYRAMFDSNPNPMWIFDPETLDFIKVNKAAVDRYGFSKSEFSKMKVTDIRPAEEAQRFKQYVEKSEDTQGAAGIWRHILKSGKEITVEVYSYDIVYSDKLAKLILALDMTDKINYQNQLAQKQQALEATNAQLQIIVKELKNSEEKLSSTQNIARIAGWVYMLENDVFKFSPHFYAILEIQEGTNRLATLHDLEKLICEEDLPKLRSFMKQFTNGDKQGECVLRISNNGKWKFIKFGALLTSNDSNQKVLEGFIQDITRLELKDQLIKTTLERFEQLATATNDTIYEWDYQNKLVRWDGKIESLIGYADREAYHKEEWWIERIHPDDFLKNHELLKEAIERGDTILKREYRFKADNGYYKLLYDQASIKYDEYGNVVKIVGSLHDIEEITRVNRENKRLGEIVNKVKNLIIISNESGSIEWANHAFLEKAGCTWQQVVNKKPWEILKYPPSSEKQVQAMRAAMQKNQFFNVEIENILKDGSSVWYQIDGSPIYDDESNCEGYIAIESDITERKSREEKIKHQNRLLKEAAWINSHQVRKPLASILGLIQLMQLSDNEEETSQYLQLLEVCSNELDATIKRAIDLTDIQN